MINLKLLLVSILIFSLSCSIDNSKSLYSFPTLSGPYLGQTPPGDIPELFAPEIISTPMYTRDIAMTPDGNEIYFCITAFRYNLIFYTKMKNGKWTEPQPAPFITDFKFMFYEPHITPNGKKLMFLSNMPREEGGEENEDIWVVDRLDDGWSKPYNLESPVNSEGSEFYPSTTREGTLYFTRAEKGSRINNIYRSKLVEGKYQTPERLGPQVNCGTNRYNAFIDPYERYLIVPATGMIDGFGGTDYYIVFRDENDQWSEPINLGEKINSARGAEWSPYISPDGKYFFFMSSKTASINKEPSYRKFKDLFNKPQNGNSDIYWVKSDFLFELEKKVKN
jgi:WD40 repeat protein